MAESKGDFHPITAVWHGRCFGCGRVLAHLQKPYMDHRINVAEMSTEDRLDYFKITRPCCRSLVVAPVLVPAGGTAHYQTVIDRGNPVVISAGVDPLVTVKKTSGKPAAVIASTKRATLPDRQMIGDHEVIPDTKVRTHLCR